MLNQYIQLLSMALVPVVFSVGLYLLDRKTSFGKINPAKKQVIFGVVFGLIAISGTEFGVNIDGAIINVRDAAPLCAGLIFGAPAGILAGLIGGIERYVAVLWGVGSYTRIACSVATFISGVFGALLRKYMFDDKIPSWYYGLTAGFIAEVFHMLMVYLTNMDDVRRAFTVVSQCAIPMITLNGLATMLALLVVARIAGKRIHIPQNQMKIAQSFQRWLLICVVIAFSLTSLFTFVLESKVSESETENLLALNISDVKRDISDASDARILEINYKVANEIESIELSGRQVNKKDLKALMERFEVSEINIVGTNGYITISTNHLYDGFDMSRGGQSAEFLTLVNKPQSSLVQAYQPMSFNNDVWRKYSGVSLSNGGFVQIGYDADSFQDDVARNVKNTTRNRHVGEDGYVLIIDSDGVVCSDRGGHEGLNLKEAGAKFSGFKIGDVVQMNIFDVESYISYDVCEGYYIIAVLPVTEAVFARNMSVYTTVFMEVLVFAALFFVISFLIKHSIVDNIRRITGALSEITSGNLDTVVNVRTNEEFSSLSDDINSTVVTLKHYIDEAAARIDKELEFAKQIQFSSLPRVFPPFPNRSEFDIWASMHTAKEVGGDFYDFYFVDNNRLAFLIADVSGKGIPAAMFMMTSKALIKSFAESGIEPAEAFVQANDELCANNDASMFVTAWMGEINTETGHVTFVNAGHNPPVVRHGDGSFEYLKSRSGLVLACMEGIPYRNLEMDLQPGDTLYLYTDGVTEATDLNNELYGEDRLLKILNATNSKDPETICRAVKADVDRFVGEAPQFDDITMVCLTYKGPAQ